ncbi:hypothetical protein JXA12_02080 [Candidatus Woesearchaeota archaeon]|nr:hypothetical protein [Candidatus Woesearchaeota archaeon]
MRRVTIALTAILLGGLLIGASGCGTTNPYPWQDPEHEQYYRGSEGVYMQFLPRSPPPIVYYYGNAGYENSFDVSVELHNMGASDAYGALFIRGYDPNIIRVEGTDLYSGMAAPGACSFSLFNSDGGLFGSMGVVMNCPTTRLAYFNDNNVHAQFNTLGELIGLPGLQYADFSLTGDNLQVNTVVNADNQDQWDQYNHGRLFSMMMGSLYGDFSGVFGYPFNDVGYMRGDNYFYPGGEFGYEDFTVHINNWPLGLDYYDVDWKVDACYAYTTYASPMICIDPQPYEYNEGDCIPHEYTWSGSQGAPVAITSLKQDPSPRSTMLTFTIKNVGTGEVIHPGYLEWCSPYHLGNMNERHKNVVFVGDVRIGMQRLHCPTGYEVRLNNGVGTFTCEYFYDTFTSAYETPVVVELWYGYRDTIYATTRIKRGG